MKTNQLMQLFPEFVSESDDAISRIGVSKCYLRRYLNIEFVSCSVDAFEFLRRYCVATDDTKRLERFIRRVLCRFRLESSTLNINRSATY